MQYARMGNSGRIVSLLLLAGCVTSPDQALKQDVGYNVPLYYADGPKPTGNYEVIKNLSVAVGKPRVWDPSPSIASVEALLRVRARRLKADAVIDVEISKVHATMSNWGVRDGKGKAIRYKR